MNNVMASSDLDPLFPDLPNDGNMGSQDDRVMSPSPFMTEKNTTDLTELDSDVKKKQAKGSNKGSKASTPSRDGVAGFLHDGTDEASRASSALTDPAQIDHSDNAMLSAPTTPKSTSSRGAVALTSPKSANTFDAKSLLNPKARQSATNQAEANSTDDDENADAETGSLLEKLYRVEKRTEAPAKRRKVHIDGENDEGHKTANFEIKGGSGVVTEFLNDERKKEVDELQDGVAVAAAIDLTDEKDQITEPEVVELKPEDDIQVVLGKLELDGGDQPQVIINNVPYMKPNGIWKPSTKNNSWPPISVRFVHEKLLLVRVVDPLRQRFGTLDARTSQAVAPLMQNNSSAVFKVTLMPRKRKDGEREGDGVSTYANLQIKVLAPRSKAKAIGRFLSQKKVWLRSCSIMMAETYYNPHDPKTFAPSSTNLNAGGATAAAVGPSYNRTNEEVRADVLTMFDSIIKTDQLPEAPQPSKIKTNLLSHQKQGLFFLTEREEDRIVPGKQNGEAFHLWKSKYTENGKTFYYNVITGTELTSRPPPMRGGILADSMGLGKTLSMLSMVVNSLDHAEKFSHGPPPLAINKRLRMRSRATLLLCPLSVISNWETQIKDHVKKGTLDYYIYHGSGRTQDLEELGDHDIIFTSYHTIAAEYKRNNSPLYQIYWYRIILDEAHTIRNSSASMSVATCELAAERRWCVTGTPVQNRLDDLGSLIKFLRIKPFDDKGAFAQYILAPFKTADPEILPKLRLLVDSITLRRLKDNIDLPGRRDLIVRLEFSSEELNLYKFFVADSKSKVQMLAGGSQLRGRTYAHILKAIMRLRLICAHGEELLSDDDRKLLEGLTKDKAIDLTDDSEEEQPQLSRKQAFEMFELMRQSSLDDCSMCKKKIGQKLSEDDEDEDNDDDEVRVGTDIIAHMTACFHLICPDCWPAHEEAVQEQIQNETLRLYEQGVDDPEVNYYTCMHCPQGETKMAHYPIKQSELDAEEAEKARIRANPKLARQMGFYRGPHTKTLRLIEYLKEFETESHRNPRDDPIKSVVFSAWTSHLDLIQIALTANNISYTRLDGTMSRKNRAAAISDFTNNPETTVILITIGAGGLGLNLTAGNKVFVMEPQFNPAAEQQAVDRVHRLGQKRDVEIIRFIMHGSFEENMLEQQAKKIELADLTVNRNRKMDRAEAAKAKLESLKSLFR